MDTRNVDTVLIRMDKIGDLVVSMPVDEHPVFATQRVHWFITKGLGFIAEQAVPKRQATEFKRRFSLFEFMRMIQWFRQHQPQTVVLLHCPWWVSCAAWLGQVKERIGRRSQWHGFLWVNLPVSQKRSASDRHESDFNFDLVEWGFRHLGVHPTPNLEQVKKTFLRLAPPHPVATLHSRGLESKGYRIVHPGMGGSALNWPSEFFAQLIEKLALEAPVVITGTKSDRKFLQPLKHLASHTGVRWMVEELPIADLLDLLSQARSVVGPSTGVLHLAASLGTPAVGIYSPRKAEHPRRWGPKGKHVVALLPTTQDTETFPASVMREITVEGVLAAIKEVEGGHDRHSSQAQPRV